MNILTPKLAYEKRNELAKADSGIDHLLKYFLDKDGKCKECDEGTLSLSLYNYIINELKSNRKAGSIKLLGCFDDDMEICIDGSQYSKIDAVTTDFIVKDTSPCFPTKVKNFIVSMIGILFKSIKHRDGFIAEKKEQKRRSAICRSCRKYNPQLESCNLCGCPIADKVKYKYSECPNKPNKWEKNVK
jgi:hypothetical protein